MQPRYCRKTTAVRSYSATLLPYSYIGVSDVIAAVGCVGHLFVVFWFKKRRHVLRSTTVLVSIRMVGQNWSL